MVATTADSAELATALVGGVCGRRVGEMAGLGRGDGCLARTVAWLWCVGCGRGGSGLWELRRAVGKDGVCAVGRREDREKCVKCGALKVMPPWNHLKSGLRVSRVTCRYA